MRCAKIVSLSLNLYIPCHSTNKPVTTVLTYPWKCTVLHCNHLGNTWKPLVLMTRHFDYCLSVSEGDNQSVRSSAPVVSRCFPGGYNVKLYISRGRLARWLLAFLHSAGISYINSYHCVVIDEYKRARMDRKQRREQRTRKLPSIVSKWNCFSLCQAGFLKSLMGEWLGLGFSGTWNILLWSGGSNPSRVEFEVHSSSV